jgi:beta-carotene 3-hydroxylase
MVLLALTTLATFVLMEGITWCTHKFVMHGFLWYLHEDHHQPKYQNIFEKNDLFFVIFALPSSMSIYFGLKGETYHLAAFGFGIALYGIAYFLVHDVLIHQRFKWFKHTKNRYLLGLRKAHKIHHKNLGKHDSECFGMLFVPMKYFKKPKFKQS